jgi:hypothetical protein
MSQIKSMLSSLLKENETMSIGAMPTVFSQNQNDVVSDKPSEVVPEKPVAPVEPVVEAEEIKLSPKSIRNLHITHIAEQMVNESVDEDEDLKKHGLLHEGKMTEKGREYVRKFLPTIYAS